MPRPDHGPSLLADILHSDLFAQLAPILVLLLVPALALLATSNLDMGLDSIGLGLSSFFSSSKPSPPTEHSSDRKHRRHTRTRTDQRAQNGTPLRDPDDGYYPGLVNISGTYCFMNATLQALASLTYLQPHIDAINAKAEALDVPTPTLSRQTEGRSNSLFYSREHQDAQELFQVVSECLKNELIAVDKEAYRDRGLGGLSNLPPETMKDIGKSVFDGLTANRRSCCLCGYTEAVMHFPLDNLQLALPRLAAVCQLEDCLEDYTRLEELKDCICRKCSVVATHKRLQQDIKKLEHELQSQTKPSNSKKERLKKVRKMEAKVRTAIQEERIEEDLKDVRMEKVFSPLSTKQAMIARPPPILALHINRSVHYGHYASKNMVRLLFPEVLDLTPYSTSGNLSTVPTRAISTQPPALSRSTTPTPSIYATPRIMYRLTAVVCHYGQHSFGHYICYRRKPKHPSVGDEKRWAPPMMLDPIRLEGDVDSINGEMDGVGNSSPRYVFEDEADIRPGKGWLRISDDAVTECGIETVLQEGTGAFMLYYERAVQETSGIYSSLKDGKLSLRGSEETLKPELRTVDLNGSVGSLVSEIGVGVQVTGRGVERERSRASSNSSVGQKYPLLVGNGTPSSFSLSPSPSLSSSSSSSSPSSSSLQPLSPPTPLQQPNGIIPSSLSTSQVNVAGARIVRNVTARSRSVTSDGIPGFSQSRVLPLESGDRNKNKSMRENGDLALEKERERESWVNLDSTTTPFSYTDIVTTDITFKNSEKEEDEAEISERRIWGF
ncbi:hypothetical protein AGABI1DRAFT_106184 [Agaricus bisporus var. burnettii JB137-S8]|uniref:ubiquitinyl hydrolase 1 n=1 Tax=Agaricus bisporus var. burnettii (strain JB137-S8 / ATCC MYA-4627 / FGSC 10392) TaxID=597362 RepID=K5X9C4_AGABU|nr:uncharacterized protein AGABI1DRAFT_106184 [Agaricus bisporus var. burnettii JB137-S8]EKM79828.1 hypothetical protein AGABI1DRAFT_106184 [Agaricus bisporus var. burnettii JB137-S8]